MIYQYDQLHQLIFEVVKALNEEQSELNLEAQIADNQSCAVLNPANGSKLVFMLAKFGDEYKVGYAYFEQYQKKPDWVDDIFSGEFDQRFMHRLLTEQFIHPTPYCIDDSKI